MTNLKQLAAYHNLYQLADIPATHINENYNWKIEQQFQAIPDFLKTVQGIEVGLFYECKTQYKNHFGNDPDPKVVDVYFIEHSYILVKSNTSENVLMLKGNDYANKGKYYFYPYYSLMHKYHNISHHLKTAALKDLKEPSRIGVFTVKKVNDWINYCNEYLAVNDRLLNEVDNNNKDIENEIANFIESLPGCKVSSYQDKTYVDTKKFEVIFTHNKSEKYLSKQVTFKGSLKDITEITALLNTSPVLS